MESIIKWSFRLGWLLLGLVVLTALLWGLSRALYPTAEQHEAMALLEVPGSFPGRNAFGLMYTANRLVPDSEMDSLLAEEERRVEQFVADFFVDPEMIPEFEPALHRYPTLEVDPSSERLFCGARESCLARVRADLPAYRKLVETQVTLLDRLERITTADHYRQAWPHSPVSVGIQPAFSHLFYPATRHALRFVEGDTSSALELACRALAGWRSIGANADSTIVRMMANVYAGEGYVGLVADMLAEFPLDDPLPTSCNVALAPPDDSELMLCNAVRGEFALVNGFRDLAGAIPGGHSLVFDAEASAGLVAQRYARFCSEQASQWIALDMHVIQAPRPILPWSWQCIANFSGCILVSAITGIHDDYVLHMNDFGFRLKALATLGWLRGQVTPETSNQALLQQRPEALRSPSRDFRVSSDEKTLIVPLHHPGVENPARLPLPNSK